MAHEHDHAQAGQRPVGRETRRFGITSFCYQRKRPFHPHRLMNIIRQLPVRQETLALAEALEEEKKESGAEGSGEGSGAAAAVAVAAGARDEASPMHALIRSKGFIWLSNSHAQMFYWALAGKHFELKQYAHAPCRTSHLFPSPSSPLTLSLSRPSLSLSLQVRDMVAVRSKGRVARGAEGGDADYEGLLWRLWRPPAGAGLYWRQNGQGGDREDARRLLTVGQRDAVVRDALDLVKERAFYIIVRWRQRVKRDNGVYSGHTARELVQESCTAGRAFGTIDRGSYVVLSASFLSLAW